MHSRLSLQTIEYSPPRWVDHHHSQVRRTSVVPMPAVPLADPPSVMRLANALVEHFGSLSLGLQRWGCTLRLMIVFGPIFLLNEENFLPRNQNFRDTFQGNDPIGHGIF